jgi:hypothetical protein
MPTSVESSPVPAPTLDAAAPAGPVDRVVGAVCKQPLHREVLYKTLGFCAVRRGLAEVEAEIATYPEFAHCAQDQYHLICFLVDAGGLERCELDEDGGVVTDARKSGLTEDEVDDLVASFAFVVTEAGAAARARLDRRRRIAELLAREPRAEAVFMELLLLCREPRAYEEIEMALTGSAAWAALEAADDGAGVVHASWLVGESEKAGALVWTGAWVLSDEGRELVESVGAAT